MRKTAREKARGIVMVTPWMETPSVARLKRMAEKLTVLVPHPGSALVSVPRGGTEMCQLLLAEGGLGRAKVTRNEGGPGAAQRAAEACGYAKDNE